MESGVKLAVLLVLAMFALSSASHVELECNSCQSPSTGGGTPAVGLPPVTLPPVSVPKLPKVTVPPIVSNPPVTLPPVLGSGSPVSVPPVLGGGGSGSPVAVPLPPVTLPPVYLPPLPIVGGGSTPKTPTVRHGGRKACPPPPYSPPTPSYDTCPIDALKLGACVDLLGNEVHIGDANVQCCPLVKGVAGLSAAACLCTAIKAKLLDLTVYVPIALSLLVNCGCAVPPGYTCA